MTHNLSQVSGKQVVNAGDNLLPTSRINLLGSASTSFIALMEYMEAMMKLAHNAAESKIASTHATSLAVSNSAKFTADVQDKQADATEFSANMQFTGMAENLCGAAVAGGSLFAQHSTTKFSRQMDDMLEKANTCKNTAGTQVGDSRMLAGNGAARPFSDEEKAIRDEYTEKLKKGAVSPETYRNLVAGKGLDEPLVKGKQVTLRHVLESAQDPAVFSELVDGVSKGQEGAERAVSRKLDSIKFKSEFGNQVVKSITSGVNGQQTLSQAQAQRDQGAASQQQALAQGGLQFLQDAMKTPDQLFSSAWSEADQVLSQNLATMVSLDTRA